MMLLNKLRELRTSKGYKQADIASVLQISREAYTSYESGRRQMNIESLCMLADFYAVSVDYLLGRKALDAESLAEDETALLLTYRALDARGKETVRSIAELEHSRVPKPKKGKNPAAM